MKVSKSKFLGFSLLFIAFTLFCSHNLYVKLESYFLQTNTKATLSLYNGSFEKSENLISRDRIIDASIVANGNRIVIDSTQWQDKDSTITYLDFKTGDAGTYVVGVSTKARNIELSSEKFNDYLIHDGVLDMLDQRTKDNKLDEDAVESYQKHVKAIYQVGDTKTDDWKTVLGYPIEFVPVSNPYESFTGETLSVQLLLDGKPLANQLVFANHLSKGHSHDHDHHHQDDEHAHDHKHDSKEHSHDHDHDNHSHDHNDKSHSHDHDHEHDKHSHDHNDKSHSHNHDNHNHDHDHAHDSETHDHEHETESGHGHTHTDGQQLRTNKQGVVEVKLPEDGVYYLRTIHMVNVTDDETLTHESKWATLSFEVTHKHDSSTHSHHDHDHDHEDGIPTWVFIVGSLIIIGILFFIFRKKD